MNGFKTINLYRILNPRMAYYVLLVVLFPMSAHQGAKAKSLITQLYRNWKDAREDLSKYAVLHYHKGSMEKLESLNSCCENPNVRIDQSVTKASTEVVNRDRKYLSSILRATEYCGRQGTALRGHRDDGPLFNDEGLTVNRGNFNELVISHV